MKYHQPVLLKEVIELLKPKPGGLYVDANLGNGGHSLAILQASSPDGKVIAFDWDTEAIQLSKQRLKKYADRLKVYQANYTEMFFVFKKENLRPADGILFDLGINSRQIDEAVRGFSYLQDGPLDMRMNPKSPLTAADLIKTSPEEDLANIIRNFGEEPFSGKIARGIKSYKEKISTTVQLKKIIEKILSGRPPKVIQNAVIRTFQALRIAVNNELDNLKKGLEAALEILKPGGRLVVVSFHSLEDRIVKNLFKTESRDCLCPPKLPVCICRHKARLKLITRKVLVPADEEIRNNPRSRSAKLRAAERRQDS